MPIVGIMVPDSFGNRRRIYFCLIWQVSRADQCSDFLSDQDWLDYPAAPI